MMRSRLMLFEAEPQSGHRGLGGEAATPPGLVQFEPHLDLVDPRPVIKLIETDPADPGACRLVDSRPRAEPVHTPLSRAPFGEPGDAVRRQVSPAPDGRVVEEALQLHAVLLAPRRSRSVSTTRGS